MCELVDKTVPASLSFVADTPTRTVMAAQDNSKKLVIIGDGNVGKTCVLEVYEKGEYVDKPYRPTIFHNTEKKIPHPKKEGEELKFQL